MEFYDISFSVYASEALPILNELGFTSIDLVILDNVKTAENNYELVACRFTKKINDVFVSIVKSDGGDGVVYNMGIMSTNSTNIESKAIEQLLVNGVINLKSYGSI